METRFTKELYSKTKTRTLLAEARAISTYNNSKTGYKVKLLITRLKKDGKI